MLPPDEMAKASASAGLNPVNFLIAASDMQKSGKIPSAPVPAGKPMQTGKRPSKKPLQVLK
jgi:hypothetical protein